MSKRNLAEPSREDWRRAPLASGGRVGSAVLLAVLIIINAGVRPNTAPAGEEGTSPAPSIVQGDAGRRVDAFLSRLVREEFSGSVLVARDREILLHKGYGLADRKRRIPVTTETVLDIASITKQFTAAAVLKLEMAGKLRTSDPLSKFLTGVPADKSAITLHHLLSNTSGLDHGYGKDTDVMPRDELIRLALGKPLLFKPGERCRYSNTGFSLAAAVVEMVSGQPYERYLRDALFAPSGMTKTGYRLARWHADEIARNYNEDRDNGPPVDRVWAPDGPYWHLFGNGGILSTTGDMYKWELALEGEGVLSRAAKAKLFKPHVPLDPKDTGDKGFYGYGWMIGTLPNGIAFRGHPGASDFGVKAEHYRFPNDRLVVIVLSNRNPLPGPKDDNGRLAGHLAGIALGK